MQAPKAEPRQEGSSGGGGGGNVERGAKKRACSRAYLYGKAPYRGGGGASGLGRERAKEKSGICQREKNGSPNDQKDKAREKGSTEKAYCAAGCRTVSKVDTG